MEGDLNVVLMWWNYVSNKDRRVSKETNKSRAIKLQSRL